MHDYVIIALTFANFGSFLWSIYGVFRSQKDRLKLHYVVFQITTLLIWGLSLRREFISKTPDLYLTVPLCFAQLSCLVTFWFHARIVRQNRFSVVFSKDLPQKLVERGFYKYVRHPFYMVYLISYGSIAIAYADPVLLCLWFSIAGIYFNAARFEESKFLSSPLADDYRRYQARTLMFAPRLRPLISSLFGR